VITVQFKDFNEMVAFAKVLLNGYQPAPEKVEKVPGDEGEAKTEPSGMNSAPADEVPFEEEKTYTLEEVRAELAKLTRAGKAKEVKELLNSFGAKNLTSLDPKHYAAVMEKAGAL